MAQTNEIEFKLKSQILKLFDYLVQNHHQDMFNEDALGACDVAVKVLEKQKTQMELYEQLNHLFKEEKDLLKLDRSKLLGLLKRMQLISMQ